MCQTDELKAEKEEAEVKIQFTNRRITASVGRTLKTDANKFEFIKFNLGFEGDISDEVDRSVAHDQIFRELMTELITREAVIKASHNLDSIDQVARLLRGIMEDLEHKKTLEESDDKNVPKQLPAEIS